MSDPWLPIKIIYDPVKISGQLQRVGLPTSSIWERIVSRAILENPNLSISDDTIELPWSSVLGLIKDFGSKQQQIAFNFRFQPQGDAKERIQKFLAEIKATSLNRDDQTLNIPPDKISFHLKEKGFIHRQLKSFQLRDLSRLLAIPHGANFSVPGAGKTTVAFALHILSKTPDQHLLVVCPKAAFLAWKQIVSDCMDEDAPDNNSEAFTVLDGSERDIEEKLTSGKTRFLISYDIMVRNPQIIANYLARQRVHLVLDESHRMKAGMLSQRGSYLLNIASLPVRRDILTGTPMPQGPDDLAAQLSFLWPGQGLDAKIRNGVMPRQVLGDLYARTTKSELGIPPAKRHFRHVEMSSGQKALYGIVRNEALRQISSAIRGSYGGDADILKARRSVMRLLQLSVNPALALQGMSNDFTGVNSGIMDEILSEGPSLKMQAVEAHVRQLTGEGKKVLVWTIFTDTLKELERMMADLNPVSLYGGTPNGAFDDPNTREGKILRFHEDPACQVIIANPAAVGEGISLHTVCHDAIYVDRSYVSTHYLQSIDRIHRLGLAPNTETNIYIYQTLAPAGLGSIDYSVNRRLALKIRALQQLLDDPDLHELAIDEEDAVDPSDFSVDLEDMVDLVRELENPSLPSTDSDEF